MAKAKKQMNNQTKAMGRPRPRPRPRIVARKSEPPSTLILKKKNMAEIQMEAKPIRPLPRKGRRFAQKSKIPYPPPAYLYLWKVPSNPDPDAVYSRPSTPCHIPDDDCDFFLFPQHDDYDYEPAASSPLSTPCHPDSPASTRLSRCSMTPSSPPPPGFPEPIYYRPPAPVFYTTSPTLLSSPDSATSPFYSDYPPSPPPPGFGFRSHYTSPQHHDSDSDSDSESVGSSFSPCHWANLAAI